MSSSERIDLARQVTDLRTEGGELFEVLESLASAAWARTTTFKGWTIRDVVLHLHFSDHMGVTTLRSGGEFQALLDDVATSGLPMVEYTRRWAGEISVDELLLRWSELFTDMCKRLEATDPGERLVWAGPGMKPRMFTTARQMEIWAHGWEIYDVLDRTRQHTDRISNIAAIGVRTFAWTFLNRGLEVPPVPPYVRLRAPSGTCWEWNDPQASSAVTGDAVEFCQVVTQVRNIADTDLVVDGDSATRWMAMAQCFAGPPQSPPTAGSRRPAKSSVSRTTG